MGHLTVLDPDPEVALARALAAPGLARVAWSGLILTASGEAAAHAAGRAGLADPAGSRAAALAAGAVAAEDRLADARRVRHAIGRAVAGSLPAPALLRGLAIACLAVALARPQTVGGRTRVAGEGVAIVVGARPEFEHERGRLPRRTGTAADSPGSTRRRRRSPGSSRAGPTT